MAIFSKIKIDLVRCLTGISRSIFYEEQKNCPLCDSPIKKSEDFCSTCKQDIFPVEYGRCLKCGKLIVCEKSLCSDCKEGRGPKSLDKVAAWGHYTGLWREYIQTVKFKSQPYRMTTISKPLADWASHSLPPPHFLIPVPMHDERLAERGFNQAQVIASVIHWELGIPVIGSLERAHQTVPQVGLTRQERLHNLEGIFRVTEDGKKKINGLRIWLIDDVITTGATLEACAKALREAGAREIFGLTLAAGKEKRTILSNQSMV